MKRTNHLAIWGAVTAMTFAAFTAPVRAQNESDKSRRTDSTFGYKKAGRAQNDKSFGQVERINKLIGKEVLGSDNQKLGKIENLVLDLESGRILYAVMGSGGVLGAGEKHFAVPPTAFTEVSGKLQLNVDKQKFNDAPQFTRDLDKDTELAKTDFVNKTHQYFGQNAWWQGGTASPAEGSFHHVRKAKDLIGTKVQNVNNENMGKVDDVMVDLRQNVGHFIFQGRGP